MWNRKRILSMALGMAMVSSSLTPVLPSYGAGIGKDQGQRSGDRDGGRELAPVLNVLRDREETSEGQEEMEELGSFYIPGKRGEPASVSNAMRAAQADGTHLAVFAGDVPDIETEKPLDPKDFKEPYSTVKVTAKDGTEYLVEVVPEGIQYFVDSGAEETSPAYEAVKALTGGLLNDRADGTWTEEAAWGSTDNISIKGSVDIKDKTATGIYGNENKPNLSISYKFTLEPGSYTITSFHREWWGMNRPMEMEVSYGDKKLSAGSVTVSKENPTAVNKFSFTLEEKQTITYTINNTGSQAPAVSWVAVAQEDISSLSLEDRGEITVRNGASLTADLEEGKMISVDVDWISGGDSAAASGNNAGGGIINNAETYFKNEAFTLYTDFLFNKEHDNTSALLMGNQDNHIRLIPRTTGGKGIFRVHTGGKDSDTELAVDLAPGSWHGLALLYSEDGQEGKVTLCLDGKTVMESVGIGFKLSQQASITAGYGITYGTGFMRDGKYDNIVVSGTADDVETAKAETKARAEEKNKLASQAPRIIIDGAEVAKAGENRNGLTFKGFGVLDCNSTNALLLDYKVQHPEKYWEMLEKLFGGEHPIVQHIKIEMGNDKNTSTGPQACTMRTSDEYPNVARVTGFQLAADAKKINPNVKVSLLYWCSPGWVGDKSNWDGVYKWLKNTIIAAYREYDYMIDIVSPGVNENKDDPNWIKEFKKRVKTDEAGMISSDAAAAGFQDGEQELFRKIQVLMSDEVGIASCGPEIMGDPELMDAVDIVGYHYNPYDDSQGNFKKLAEQYDKEVWNSEAQATFGSTADRPNNNMKEQNNTAGTGIGGNGGPLEMADTAIKGFVNSRRTHFVYQPTFGAFYEGGQYNYKDVMSARDPWSGYVNYDAALNIFQHFTKFAVTGWEDNDPETPEVWRGIPGASKSEATGSNPVNGRNGGDNYMTLAAPDKTGFSVIITNDCSKTKTYAIYPKNMALEKDAKLEVWETRAADEGEVYNANYMKCVNTLSVNGEGCYEVVVKPWSIVTVTTMTGQNAEELALPTATEDGRYVLDTDETGKVQDTTDTWLYGDDFNYQGIAVKDYENGAIVDNGDTFIETRGGEKGFYPLYTHDVNGSFEVVMNEDGTDGVLRMNGQTGGGWWNGGEPATIIGDYRWTNYKASVDFNLDSVKEHLLLGVRQRGAAGGGDNKVSMCAYNLALNREGDWVARRYGSEIARGKAEIKNTRFCNVAVQAAGDTVTFFIEGEPVYTYKDPSPQLEGRVMLGVGLPGESWTAGEFDNLKVETVPGYSPYYASVYDNLHMKKWGGAQEGQEALVYTGDWNHKNQSSSSHSQRSISSTSEVGASVSYAFEGTGFALIGPNGGTAKVNVEVDGKEVCTDAPTIATSSHQPYFVVRGLKDGPHTVTVSLASGTLDVDSFAYIKANEQAGASVNTEALAEVLAEMDGLREEDYFGQSWENYQAVIAESGRFTKAMAQEMCSAPQTYGADQEGIDEAAAYLRAEMNKLVSADAPVEILDKESLPEMLAIPQGGTVEDLAGAQLPETVKVKKADNTEGEAEITWNISGDTSQVYGTAEAVGTVAGGKDPETGEALTVSIPVEVTSPEIVYFIDPGTDDTRVYDLYKATCPELKNETNDKVSQGGSWGRSEANIKSNTEPADKLDTGIYSGNDIVYTLPLKAGIYTLTAGFTEWWGYGRDMSQTISYTLGDGTVKSVSGSDISFGEKGKAVSSTAFIVTEDAIVTYTLKKTKSQDSVLSWLGVMRMADMEDASWAPVFESDESNQWAGLVTYGTVTQKDDPEQGQVLHMNGAGTTYAQFDPDAIDFTSRENMTLSFDLKSETADGNFFTVAMGQDSDKYFFLRTRKGNTYTAITTGSWGAEQKKESNADTYDKWVHMDLVFSPEKIITYIDGVPQITLDKTILMTNLGKNPIVYLGKSFYSGDKYFAGAFDNIKVYNRSRGQQELALSHEVAKAEKLENVGYGLDSWNNFMAALADAKAAAGDETLTDDQRAAAKEALLAAINALETDLAEMVKKAAELKAEDYTADSWTGFAAALAEAQNVLANPSATQEEKDQAKNNLQTAMESLVKVTPEVKVDMTELKEAIESAEALKGEDYTAESWKAVEAALKTAKEVLADGEATQDQVNEAAKALKAACEKLEKKTPEKPEVKVDMTALKAAIEDAEVLKAEDYTAESWKAVEDALKAAKEVLSDEGASQKQVDEAAKALKDACGKLEKKIPEEPEVKVDMTALKEAIEDAEALKAEDYTAESWKAVEDAIKTAKEVLSDKEATQKQVDEAAKVLREAVEKLEKKMPEKPEVKVDMTALKAAIEEAEALKAEDYTAESWKAVEDALKAAKEVLSDEGASQKQVDGAAKALKDACEKLEKKTPETPEVKVDMTALKAAIESAEALKAEDYTAESWKAVEDALKAAKEVLSDEGTSQKQVDEAAKALKEACEKLEKKTPEKPEVKVDMTALKEAIESAEALKAEDYTAESWKAVEDALKAARETLSDEGASQKQVDDAAKALKEAMENLEKKIPEKPEVKVDVTVLKEAIESAEKLKAEDYTAESWKAVEDALKAAKEALSDEGVTQKQVDDAAKALREAIEKLEMKGQQGGVSGGGIIGGTTSRPGHRSPQTSSAPAKENTGAVTSDTSAGGSPVMTGNVPSDTREGSWSQSEDGTWKLTKPDGSEARNEWACLDSKWYLFDDDGEMVEGWANVNGTWYYCDPENGDMKTDWQMIDGKWYYMDSQNGGMKTGWQMINGKWYYLDQANGDMKTGRIQVDGIWYDLAADGSLVQ